MSQRTWRTTTTALSVCVVLIAASRDAAAEECATASSPEAARELAGDAFSEGQRLFQAENFARALDRFECSFSLVPHHNTLYNIGECKEALGDLTGALAAYRDYIRRYPDEDGRADVEARIGAVVVQMETSPSPPPPDQTPPPPDTQPDDGTQLADPEPPAGATRMTLARRLAWVSLATGVAFTALGGGLYGAAVARNDEFHAAQDDPTTTATQEELEDLRDRGQALGRAGVAFMVLGGVAVATSVLLFLAFAAREPVNQTGAAPSFGLGSLTVTPTGLGLSAAF